MHVGVRVKKLKNYVNYRDVNMFLESMRLVDPNVYKYFICHYYFVWLYMSRIN